MSDDSKEWQDLLNSMRAFIEDDSRKAVFLLGTLMGVSGEGKLSVAEALKLALFFVQQNYLHVSDTLEI